MTQKPLTAPPAPASADSQQQAADTAALAAPKLLAKPSSPDSCHTALQLFAKTKDGVIYLNGKPLFDTPLMEQMRRETGILAPQKPGVAGELLPYRFRNDDYVTSALLLCFFFIAWIIAGSRHYLLGLFRNFFRPQERHNLFTPQEQTELRGSGLLVFHTSFVAGILAFDYVQECMPALFNAYSPYLLLLVPTLASFAYYQLKIGLYRLVNNIFFDRPFADAWQENYLLSILTLGLLLYPVALLVVFFDMSIEKTLWSAGMLFGLSKALLFLKSFYTFSERKISQVHIFLYLCTLEMMPLLTLWAATAATLDCPTTLN